MRKKISQIIFWILLGANCVTAQEYAHIYINDNSSANTITAGIWETVTGFSSGLTSTNWGFNGATDQLEPTTSGIGTYFVRFSLSFQGETGIWDSGISINHANPTNLIIQRTIDSSTDVGNVSATGFIEISSTNDKISLKVKGPGSGSISFTAIHAQVTLIKLTESSGPNYFAEMSIYNNSATQTMNTSFQTITGYSAGDLQGDATNGWTFASNTLTANGAAAGTYLAILSTSFEGATNTDYDIGLSKNGTDPDQILIRRTTSANDLGNAGTCGIISVADLNTINIKSKASSNNKNIKLVYSDLILIKISGTATPPYAEMKIENGSSALTLTQNVWESITDFSADEINSNFWQFQNDALKPINLAAGNYMVNYYVSAGQSGTETNFVFEISGFKNNTEENDLTVSRKLFKNMGDVGAASGNALISIQVPSDSITLKLRNIDNDDEIVAKYVNLNLIRINKINDGSLPVSLTSFNGQMKNNKICLEWVTESEINNLGFIMKRKIAPATSYETISSYDENEALRGLGTSTVGKTYSFEDSDIRVGNTYFYKLIDVDYNGIQTEHLPIKITYSRSSDRIELFALYQNYPNPFNPITNIQFSLPETGEVTLNVYNNIGQLVRTLVNGSIEAGYHSIQWDGKNENGQRLSSGVYIYRITSDTFSQTRKMILSK